MESVNQNSLVNLNDLPPDIQQKIREHREEQRQLELRKRFNDLIQERQNTTHITINNHNIYNINILKNDGTINEKQDSLLNMFAKAAGRAAGKTWAWLEQENK